MPAEPTFLSSFQLVPVGNLSREININVWIKQNVDFTESGILKD